MSINFISVIIPAYKNWGLLQLCINALATQSYPSEKFEIIVVNNDPEDPAPNWLSIPGNCRFVDQYTPGSYAARNKGASTATGDLYLFTDADCIPDENWIFEIVNLYNSLSAETNYTIVAGGVALFGKNGGCYNFAESYDYFVGLNQHLYVKKGAAVTANLAIPKALFDDLNGFDEAHFSGGDTDFCMRAKRRGACLIYLENAFIQHPLRDSISELLKKDKRLIGAKFHRAKIKTTFLAISPPIVRSKLILVNRKGASPILRAKAFCTLLILWANRAKEVIKIILNPGYHKIR